MRRFGALDYTQAWAEWKFWRSQVDAGFSRAALMTDERSRTLRMSRY